MKRFKIFFFNSLLIIASSLILQIIRMIFNVYVSNKISAEALGIFQLIMVTYYFGITLASSGINISCLRVVSEELAVGNIYGVKHASKNCIKLALTISILVSCIFYLNAKNIAHFFFHNRVSCNIVYLICLALPLISMSSAITGYFMAVRRVYKTILGDFLEQFSKITAIILLFNVYKNNLTLENICFLLILGDLISEIISFCYDFLIYKTDLAKNFCSNKSISKENYIFRICRILFPVSFTSCIKSGISTFKQLLIPSSLEKSGKNCTEALSEYGVISGMAMPIVMFPSTFLIAVSVLLIPEFSRYYVKKDYRKIKLYTDKLLIYSFAFSLILTILFCVFGNNLGIIIYHNREVGIFIKIFSLLIPFIYVDIIIDNILKGLDAQTDVMIINIIDLIVSTTFIFFFVPVFGIKGYIASIFVSEILNLCLSLGKLLRLEKNF